MVLYSKTLYANNILHIYRIYMSFSKIYYMKKKSVSVKYNHDEISSRNLSLQEKCKKLCMKANLSLLGFRISMSVYDFS